MTIGIFYGSTTGTTQGVAERLGELLGVATGDHHNIADCKPERLADYDALVFGTSTWGYGDLQDDWEAFIGKAGGVKLGGKKVAVFGLGDAGGYADTFVDGMADLAAFATEHGAEVVGAFPADCYGADASRAENGGHYLGLALDEDGHGELTYDRLQAWSLLLKAAFA